MNAITKGYQDVPMTRRRAQLLAEYADKLAEMLENAPDDQDLAEWVQSKIDRAAGAIQSAYHYLDQEDDEDLEKAVGHKYTHRKRVGTDKRGRARYRYYYAEHQGGGITRASFEAGSAFKLTYKGRRGHFHIHHVEGDQVFITHDSRPDMQPVAISKSELRTLLKRQHTKAEQAHVEKRRKEVERIKSRNVKRGLGLALHRLRQAAQVAGVELDERYQRKPKKKRPAQATGTPREDRFDTMPEVEDLANKKTFRERSLALRGYKPEELIEIAAHAFIRDKAVNKEADAKAGELKREYEILSNTEARLGSEEELAKEGGLYRYQDAEQATREKQEEILNLSRIDTYNKVYRDVISHLRDQKTNYPERRNAIEGRIKELSLSVDNLETMPEVTPVSGTAQRQSVLGAAEEAQRLDAQGGSKRSATAIEADERLIETIKTLISNEYQDVEDVTRSDRPPRQWTVKERELNRLTDSLETLQSAKRKTRSMTEATAQSIREATRGRLINEMRSRIATDSRIKPPTPRNELTETAQQIIEEANQDHEERHDEHQEITRFELGEHTHTRTGQKLFTAKQTERVDRDEYFRRVEIAKKHRGRYERRYVKGFVFKNAEDARNFALEVEGDSLEERTLDPDVREQAKSTFHRLSNLVQNLKSWTVMRTQTDSAVYHSATSAVTILKRGGKYFVEIGPVDDRQQLTMGTVAHFLRTSDGRRGFDTARHAAKAAISFMRENDAETVTPHEDHPSAENFETMPEVESAPTQRLRGVLDALSESERLNTINPKNRKRPKEAKGADAKLITLINELAEDQDPNERRLLRVLALKLQGVEKNRNAYERQESRNDVFKDIRVFVERKLDLEPTVTAPNLSEILSQPTTPSTRPANVYGRATKKLVDQALSSEPTDFDPNRSGIDLPTKGDLREMLSQEQRLARAKEDLRSAGAPNFLGQSNPLQDIMYALDRYLSGPYVELDQKRLRDMERGLKIALRDSRGEELEQVKGEISRFWREWGGEYKRLQDEFARGRTQGEALRNIRPFIPERALTPEINQVLDQMEQELDQRPVTGHDIAQWIDTRDTNKATRDSQPTTPREQLTETVREISDQPARTAAVSRTPRASEATLTGSGDLSDTERRDLTNRARFITSGSEEATKTGRRSKAQKAKDQELLLIYNRLHSDASARLGPLAPRFADYSQFVKLRGGDLPERAQTRADFRVGIMSSIEELRNATTAQPTSSTQKSATHLINYRAQLLQTIERIA